MNFKQGLWLSLLILILFWVSQLLLAVLAANVLGWTPEQFQQFNDPSSPVSNKGDITAFVALGSGIIGILGMVVILKLKKIDSKHFFALNKFQPKHLLIFFVLWGLLLVGIGWLEETFDVFKNDFTSTTTQTSSYPLLLLLGIGIVGPVFEELFFRGFLFRVLLDYHNNGLIAVIITSLVFSIVHLQYNPAVLLLVFSMGLVLGFARLKSNSIHLPILLHVINNSIIASQMGL